MENTSLNLARGMSVTTLLKCQTTTHMSHSEIQFSSSKQRINVGRVYFFLSKVSVCV